MNLRRTLARSGSDNGNDGTFRPQLTSLVDVMTILLVFLIKSFAVDGNIITPSNDLQLPISISQTPPKPACALEISQTAVIADGREIASIGAFAASDSLEIPELLAWMQVQHAKSTDSAAAREVLIQADRETAFAVLKKVMFTCSKAGYTDFSVLVLGDE
jgi:biopolymer transport protein ExbD